jgi:hypothetical protein
MILPSNTPVAVMTGEAVNRLGNWVKGQNWSGYDPYDLQALPLHLWACRPEHKKFFPARAVRGAFAAMDRYCPQTARTVFAIRKAVNPKALGLFARAYLTLYELRGEDRDAELAHLCLQRLEECVNQSHGGWGWGYPFNWQSRVLIPAGTPNAVVSYTVGDAFWRAYQTFQDKRYLDICLKVCDFFLRGLNRDITPYDDQCFSYTPLDRMHVLNVSLFVSELLAKVGVELKDERLLAEGWRGAKYVVRNQNSDGSWYYFGPEDKLPGTIDHYHTGFVLRSLAAILEVAPDEQGSNTFARGFRYYWEHLFTADHLPTLFPGRLYPINIHAVAEGILSLSELGRLEQLRSNYPIETRLEALLGWATANMQGRAGYFYYAKTQRRTVRIPFMRWGQAWMMAALTEALRFLEQAKESRGVL